MARKTEKKPRPAQKLKSPAISARLGDTGGAANAETGTQLVPMDGLGWAVNGELILNCSCEVFCPCVVSLGQHPPTNGYCQAWIAIRIDEGHLDGVSFGGLNAAYILDIPGKMGDGNWTLGLYIDDRASGAQMAAMETVLSGQRGGTTGLFRMLVGTYLGAKSVPISYDTEGDVRHFRAGKAILGSIKPITGADPAKPVTIENSTYWMSPSVVIAQALKSRLRDFGRVWNFDECSADITYIRWSGK